MEAMDLYEAALVAWRGKQGLSGNAAIVTFNIVA